MTLESQITAGFQGVGNHLRDVQSQFVFPIGGQFLLDPNEFNAWGGIGPYDDTNSQDLGNVGAAVNRIAGGICFPWDVELLSFFAWHRNNNNENQAWGWRIVKQEKTSGGNSVVNTDILAEVADNGGVGPRDYLNTTTQNTDVNFSTPTTIAAGEVLILGVESPTAVTTNRYVQVMSGYLLFRRVL